VASLASVERADPFGAATPVVVVGGGSVPCRSVGELGGGLAPSLK
jgi:hypothetical protein